MTSAFLPPNPQKGTSHTPSNHPKSWRRFASILIVALCCGALWGCPKKTGQDVYKGPPRTTFYQIKAPMIDGSTYEFNLLYNKVAVVDFFATSCAHCEVVQIPLLKKLYLRHRKEGLAVVGIALQPQAKVFLRPFLQVLKLPYPVVVGGKQFLQGKTEFGFIQTIPRSYLLDRCGRIRHFHSGVAKPKVLTTQILALLKEKPNCPR